MGLADGAAWDREHPPTVAAPTPTHGQQADGYVEAEETELVEEMAATTVLYEVFDNFISNLNVWFSETIDTSMAGNPVVTHMDILGLTDAVITEAHSVRDQLIELLAKRGEEFQKSGLALTKQVIDEEV